MEQFHILVDWLVEFGILLFELTGVLVLIVAGLRGIFDCVRRDPLARLRLAKGMAMGLEFKLGSEILRTVVVREFQEILIVAGIIALRAILTFLIHWEIRNEERQEFSTKEAVFHSPFAHFQKNKTANLSSNPQQNGDSD